MDNRSIELNRRYAEAFLSTYQPEENPTNETAIIPLSLVIKMMDRCEPPMVIDPFEALGLMVRHKFGSVRKNGEFLFFVKDCPTK